MRRPSPALVLALVALFVALDGPALAQKALDGKLLRKGSVTTKAIKDRTVGVADLSRGTRRSLRAVPDEAITEAKLADGSVTTGKLAAGAVGGAALADRSVGAADLAAGAVTATAVADGAVTGAEVADGTLTGADVARFSGRFRITVPPVPAFGCWGGAPAGLAAEQAGADISDDLVLATPGGNWLEDRLAFTVSNDGDPRRFVISACNATGTPTPGFEAGIRYAVVDVP